MEARPTLRRLLSSAAAFVLLGMLASGCGGGSKAQAAPKADPPLQKYSDRYVSFAYPANWAAKPSAGPGEFHFHPLVYLSTQPVHNPCSVNGNTTTCDWPVRSLQPGGVLALWQLPYPLSGAGGGTRHSGRRITVGGHPAWRTDTQGGSCSRIGADRTVDVSVPSSNVELTVCLRRPGLAQDEKNIDAMLASTKFPSQ
jgi:hypothetical protein